MEARINPAQVKVESHGHTWKHVVVALQGVQTISWAVNDPSVWKGIQTNQNLRLRRGDEVTLVTPDGNVIWQKHPVLRADAEVQLGPPLRKLELIDVALYRGKAHEVVPMGSQFAIRNLRDGTVDPRQTYATEDQAKQEILKRQTVQAQ